MNRLKLLLSSILVVVVGCADVANYQANLSAWIGLSEQALVSSWGAPTLVSQNGNVRLLTYIRNDGTYISSTYWGPRVQSLFCTTTFTILNDVIKQAQFEGNECVAN